ncbi:MAG TPA: hypothetical protein VGM54_12250 [Chthoniobacter sp.]|jgi:hypothetical protein
MKRLSFIPALALALLALACEKHPASQLPEEGATAFGEHSASAAEAKAGEPAATPGTPAPSAEGKEAPKFFPQNK